MSSSFLIKSESDFHDFISKMMAKKDLDLDDFDFPDVKFEGWPSISINVKGDPERYSSSVTASMLFGMCDLTNEIQKAFTFIRHDTHNRQKLTNSDKHILDIVYHISEGSSQADGDSDAIVNGAVTVLKEAFGKMSGRQALCALVAIVIAVGTVSWKAVDGYWDTQKQSSSDQVSVVEKVTDAMNKQQEIMAKQQNNILTLLTTGETTVSREVLAHGEDGKEKLLKNLAQDPKVSSVKIGDKVVDRDQLNHYNHRQSVDRSKKQRTDEFYIKGVSRTGPDNQEISITVTRASNSETFIIKTTSEITSTDELKVFTDAVAKENILKINYLEVVEDNHISAGQLISVNEDHD